MSSSTPDHATAYGAWIDTPGDVECVHVACDGFTGCQYQPPALGPQLPRQIKAADGSLWTSHGGRVYYLRKPDGGYELAMWSELARHAAGHAPGPRDRLPAGPWTVTVA